MEDPAIVEDVTKTTMKGDVGEEGDKTIITTPETTVCTTSNRLPARRRQTILLVGSRLYRYRQRQRKAIICGQIIRVIYSNGLF